MLFKLLSLCLKFSICMVGLSQMGEQRHKHLWVLLCSVCTLTSSQPCIQHPQSFPQPGQGCGRSEGAPNLGVQHLRARPHQPEFLQPSRTPSSLHQRSFMLWKKSLVRRISPLCH